jgi:hypothetical protein
MTARRLQYTGVQLPQAVRLAGFSVKRASSGSAQSAHKQNPFTRMPHQNRTARVCRAAQFNLGEETYLNYDITAEISEPPGT